MIFIGNRNHKLYIWKFLLGQGSDLFDKVRTLKSYNNFKVRTFSDGEVRKPSGFGPFFKGPDFLCAKIILMFGVWTFLQRSEPSVMEMLETLRGPDPEYIECAV